MLETINISTLAVLGFIDFVSYKIPNVILVGWIGALAVINLENSCANSTAQLFTLSTLMASTLVTGSYFILSRIVKCSAGDFKLYGVLTVAKGIDSSLPILFISCLISLFPIAGGTKKVPMAFITFFGYIAFCLLKMEGFI